MEIGDAIKWVTPEVLIKEYDYKNHLLSLNPYVLTKKAIEQDLKISSVIVVSANLFGFTYDDYVKKEGTLVEEDGLEYFVTLDSNEGIWVYNRIITKVPVLQYRKAFIRIAHPLNHILNQIKERKVYETKHLEGTIFDIKKDGIVMVQTYYGLLYYINSRYITVM